MRPLPERGAEVNAGPDTHRRIVEKLSRRFDCKVMDNLYRGDYAEYLVGEALAPDWRLTWSLGWGWAPWDCEQELSGARLEVKQSAARQSWDGDGPVRRRYPAFDIAPRTGYWTQDGSRWIEFPKPMRAADVYVFAWHGEREHGVADHRNVGQWRFHVVAEPDLPPDQKTIALSSVRSLAPDCGFADLHRVVQHALPAKDRLKQALESSFGAREQ